MIRAVEPSSPGFLSSQEESGGSWLDRKPGWNVGWRAEFTSLGSVWPPGGDRRTSCERPSWDRNLVPVPPSAVWVVLSGRRWWLWTGILGPGPRSSRDARGCTGSPPRQHAVPKVTLATLAPCPTTGRSHLQLIQSEVMRAGLSCSAPSGRLRLTLFSFASL